MSSILEAPNAREHGGIDPRAAVDPRARLDPSVEVAAFAVVGPEVVAHSGVTIGAHAVLEGQVVLERGVQISAFASIGSAPQDLRYDGAESGVRIGARSVVREYTTINRGTGHDPDSDGPHGWTLIGEHTLIMAYCHVAHDCHLGDHVVLANGATLAGHVRVDDEAIFGGHVAVHQHTRIGRLAFLAGGAMVERDVPPYCRVAGDRARLVGLNEVGLRRGGLPAADIAALRAAYRDLFRTTVPLAEAVGRVQRAFPDSTHVQALAGFIESSQRGLCR